MKYQSFLDRLNGKKTLRWSVLGFLFFLFLFRVIYFHGWYIICYGLGIYVINLFIAFISPKFRPEEDDDEDEEDEEANLGSATLPSTSVGRNFASGGLFGQPKQDADDVKPFVRRLPEFKFWYSLTKGVVISLLLSSTRILDIPVYWPILLGYWIILLAVTLRKQIRHMIKHRYLPFTTGKKSYSGSLFGGATTAKPTPSSSPSTGIGGGLRASGMGSYQSAFSAYQPQTSFTPTLLNVNNTAKTVTE
ncbi:predicted protein [Naegleria gruberi]|uniref:Predicted protein n=1 Tax=Naegleria gruberi TaxID=5762 RepID=D2VUW2_NAEGR|nr:uncharacterized protein NAEGRDRAFT_81308 [Naegleria gruberi]EFC39390.1 predicted protein [Naegleria gruberi]|eukprot:XP_002672134.1 predicted protein [Naegleria gruberi strain NEG-M]